MRNEAHGGAQARADLVECAIAAVGDHGVGLLEQGRGVVRSISGKGSHAKGAPRSSGARSSRASLSKRANRSSSEDALASTGHPNSSGKRRAARRGREHVASQDQRAELTWAHQLRAAGGGGCTLRARASRFGSVSSESAPRGPSSPSGRSRPELCGISLAGALPPSAVSREPRGSRRPVRASARALRSPPARADRPVRPRGSPACVRSAPRASSRRLMACPRCRSSSAVIEQPRATAPEARPSSLSPCAIEFTPGRRSGWRSRCPRLATSSMRTSPPAEPSRATATLRSTTLARTKPGAHGRRGPTRLAQRHLAQARSRRAARRARSAAVLGHDPRRPRGVPNDSAQPARAWHRARSRASAP